MAQKAYIIEGISGKDILEHEPIASQIAEGFQVSSINAFNKDGKPMCLVLLSDGESSGGGGSDSDYLAPPVFSPADTIIGHQVYEDSVEVTLTAEDGATILYNADYFSDTNHPWTTYEEPLEFEDSRLICAIAIKDTGDDEGIISRMVAAYYVVSGGK